MCVKYVSIIHYFFYLSNVRSEGYNRGMTLLFCVLLFFPDGASAQNVQWGEEALSRIPLPGIRVEALPTDPLLEADMRALRGAFDWYVASLRAALQSEGRGSLRIGTLGDYRLRFQNR